MNIYLSESDSTSSTDAGTKRENLAGKARKKIIHAIDQNDDGAVDLKDVAMIADNMGNNAILERKIFMDSPLNTKKEYQLSPLMSRIAKKLWLFSKVSVYQREGFWYNLDSISYSFLLY